jgi:hypothetical protein
MKVDSLPPLHIPGYNALDEQQRAVIAWQYRTCGDFKRALFEAIAAADDENLMRLRAGFPVEVDGFMRFQRQPGWWQMTVKAAGGDVEAGY